MDDFKFSLRNVGKNGEDKRGRYSNSMYWDVKNFGKSKWVVLGYIDIDWPYLELKHSLSKSDILDKCLEELNKAPERKKYQKRESRPLYGKLEKYNAQFVNDEKPYIIYQFITDDHKNEFFIGDPPRNLTV